jgi:sialate O-acetylesterase
MGRQEIGILALAALLATVGLPTIAIAQALAFGPTLSDEAVLQRGQPIAVSGRTKPAGLVRVTLGEAVRDVKADSEGRWRAEFPARQAATGIKLVAQSGAEQLELKNIAVGDVFLCSGQSNMQFSMAETALNATERKVPIDRSIGLLSVPIAPARVEQADFAKPARWTSAFADSADFSAICLIAGRAIAKAQNVPVGLIDAAMGGTPIEAWLPYEGLKQAGGQEAGLAILDAFRTDPVAAEARHGAQLDAMWQMPPPPGQAAGRPRMGYANLFNGMVAPLAGTRLAGVIWYQGENNTRRDNAREAYRLQLQALLASWRGRFGESLPFVIVQLAPFGPLSDRPDEHNWAEVREAQRQVAQADPHTEMVTTVDVGERLDIHPPLKKPVGQRAAMALSHLLYGASADVLGPRPHSAVRSGREVLVQITNGGVALMAASWGRPGPFILCRSGAAPDCRFADARLTEGGIAIEVAEDFAPDLVRYCWGAAPICNVFDRAQRPLPPFELPITASN